MRTRGRGGKKKEKRGREKCQSRVKNKSQESKPILWQRDDVGVRRGRGEKKGGRGRGRKK